MHPLLILIPAAVLILGPKLWVVRVLRQYDRQDTAVSGTAGELARRWLDRYQLQGVKVEITDIGDHYDPETKSVRLTRDKYQGKTLTALTTAAHEVSHALQDAEEYAPFVWRNRLGKLALATGQVGTVVLISVPASALLTHRPIPPALVGSTLLTMLGTGFAVQLAALFSELDASFKRALPLLQDGYISGAQIGQAKHILLASSLTYAASSLISVLYIWPWLGRGRAAVALLQRRGSDRCSKRPAVASRLSLRAHRERPAARRRKDRSHPLVRGIGKPLIRAWLRVATILA